MASFVLVRFGFGLFWFAARTFWFWRSRGWFMHAGVVVILSPHTHLPHAAAAPRTHLHTLRTHTLHFTLFHACLHYALPHPLPSAHHYFFSSRISLTPPVYNTLACAPPFFPFTPSATVNGGGATRTLSRTHACTLPTTFTTSLPYYLRAHTTAHTRAFLYACPSLHHTAHISTYLALCWFFLLIHHCLPTTHNTSFLHTTNARGTCVYYLTYLLSIF